MPAPVHKPQLPPLLPCSQHLVQPPWPQRRSRSRGRPQGQHHAAIPGVGRLALEPAPNASLSAHFLSHLLLPQCSHSLGHNQIGDQGASALATTLNGTRITNLKCASCPTLCSLSCQRQFTPLSTLTSAPASVLAVSGITKLETRAPPRSPPSSRRRRSPGCCAPPPQSAAAR